MATAVFWVSKVEMNSVGDLRLLSGGRQVLWGSWWDSLAGYIVWWVCAKGF